MMTSPMATAHQPLPTRRTWKGPRTIPASLAHLAGERRFVLWRYGGQPNSKGKYKKLPISPHKFFDKKKGRWTYGGAKMDDAESWGTWDECMAAATDWKNWFDGIGMVLCEGEIGIDLDDGIDQEQADRLIAMARGRAYLDQSVSGTGYHIIVLGQVAAPCKTDTIEVYPGGSGRYFCLGTELEGSSAPAPAQDVIDQAITLADAKKQASAPRASLRMVETVALTAELAADIRDAASRLPELLRALPGNMTGQLADLLYRGTFPSALKDTSPSGARSVVVAQLHRAPKRYTDAEIYVLARDIWRRKGYEGRAAGNEGTLDRDAWRLIAKHRWNAPPKSDKRTYQEAPDPLVYLARLADERGGDLVPLNRDERAGVVGCTRATAQRTEEKLVAAGLIELITYALRDGQRGRRGAIRITPTGLAALSLANESVIQSEKAPAAANDQVKPIAPESAKPSIAPPKYTLLCDRGQRAPAPHKPRVPNGAGARTESEAPHVRTEERPPDERRSEACVQGRCQDTPADRQGAKHDGQAGGEMGAPAYAPGASLPERGWDGALGTDAGTRSAGDTLTIRERCELAGRHVKRRQADRRMWEEAMAYADAVLAGRLPPPAHLPVLRSEYSPADRRFDEAISCERYEAQAQPPPGRVTQDAIRFPRSDWPADIWEWE